MSTREIAEQIVNQVAVGCWQFQSPGWLMNAIDAALKQAIADERERCAGIAEAHYTDAIACPGGAECSLRIATTIRRDDTADTQTEGEGR